MPCDFACRCVCVCVFLKPLGPIPRSSCGADASRLAARRLTSPVISREPVEHFHGYMERHRIVVVHVVVGEIEQVEVDSSGVDEGNVVLRGDGSCLLVVAAQHMWESPVSRWASCVCELLAVALLESIVKA